MATGGDSVAKLADGRVAFVRGALPGESVLFEIEEEKKRFVRGVAVEILVPSPARIEPRCPHAYRQCGGCDWIHIDAQSQVGFKRDLVVEQLQRLGGIEAPVVTIADHAPGRRTTVRCTVSDGRAGYRSRRSHRGFVATECSAAHPLVEELILDGHFGTSSEVTIRAGASTGERLVVVDGPLSEIKVPDDVTVVHADDRRTGAIHEEIGGHRWRISARSFFQTSHEGAEALVGAVGEAMTGSAGPVVDLYAGVGLLGGAVAPERLVAAVEQSPASVADARANLAASVDVVEERVERWQPTTCEVVIADPARRGLGPAGTDVVSATQATRVVLVSCDPAALGRDTKLLREQGYEFASAAVIDMFPDTSRVEVVSRFDR